MSSGNASRSHDPAARIAVVDLGAAGAADALDGVCRDPEVVGIVITGECMPGRPVLFDELPAKPMVQGLSGRIGVATLALACLCDVRVAAGGSTLPVADVHGSGVLPALAGLTGAARLPELLVAEELTADRLRELGVVSDVVPASELVDRAVLYARRLAELDAEGLAILRERRLPREHPGVAPDRMVRAVDTAVVPPAAAARQTDLRVVPGVRSGAQTRQKILDAAAKVLRTHGYTACRLSDIAKLCGTHQTSVYHYFASKEALVDEVLRVGVTRTYDSVRAAVEALPVEASALDRLVAAIRSHLRLVLVSGDYATAAMRVTGELPKESYERIRQVQHDYGHYWARLFTEASDAGFLRPGMNLSVNRAFVAGALNYAIEWYDPAKGGVDELADEFIPTILSGLAEPDRLRDLDLATSAGRDAMPALTT